MGRPAHHPEPSERRQVEAMADYGVPEADIARVLGIDPKTLRKHYRGELDRGHIIANIRVAECLFHKATGDGRQSVTAAIFWLKARAGWKETSLQELSARIEAPSAIELVSPRERVLAALERLAPPRPGELAAGDQEEQS